LRVFLSVSRHAILGRNISIDGNDTAWRNLRKDASTLSGGKILAAN
jgi:hypothetical protein